jgi:hypothetical protein
MLKLGLIMTTSLTNTNNQNHPSPTDDDLTPLPDIETGFYQHYKGGLYEVKALARHSEDLSPYVVYQALYGEMGLWIRPAAMFAETIEINGLLQKRFNYIGKTLNPSLAFRA